jgi:hypothetical protein
MVHRSAGWRVLAYSAACSGTSEQTKEARRGYQEIHLAFRITDAYLAKQ